MAESKRDSKVRRIISKFIGICLVIFVIIFSIFLIRNADTVNRVVDRYIASITQYADKFIKKPETGASTKDGNANLIAEIKKSREFLDGFLEENLPQALPEEENAAPLRLEGIVFNPEERSSAIINGKVLYEGENLENIRIIKINKDSVEISVGGIKKILEVNQGLP